MIEFYVSYIGNEQSVVIIVCNKVRHGPNIAVPSYTFASNNGMHQ